jgi:hypothetical protein
MTFERRLQGFRPSLLAVLHAGIGGGTGTSDHPIQFGIGFCRGTCGGPLLFFSRWHAPRGQKTGPTPARPFCPRKFCGEFEEPYLSGNLLNVGMLQRAARPGVIVPSSDCLWRRGVGDATAACASRTVGGAIGGSREGHWRLIRCGPSAKLPKRTCGEGLEAPSSTSRTAVASSASC